eukprot:c32762_g1_i1.p2 GENE.c32762_g1_i1~~c32762_g1_i1.p2  ORF type:complete len:638 (+),score=187.49 c32762_g1_i1:31-1914(+)
MAAHKKTADDYRAIARGFPSYSSAEVNDLIRQFNMFDEDGNGSVTTQELGQMMRNLGEDVTEAQLRAIIAEVDSDRSGSLEFDEFLTLVQNVRSGKSTSKMGAVVQKAGDKFKLTGATASSEHTFSEEEKVSFTDYINQALGHDRVLADRLPMDPESMALFPACNDGILLCKLINDAVPNTIDERAINQKNLNAFKIVENQNLVINSAKAIGCNVVNIGQADLSEGKHIIIMGLIWQIIRIGLLNRINLANHPELFRLLEEGETLEDLMKLPPDQILLRWFNYHLKRAGHPKRVTNFGPDIADSEAYTVLLNQLAPRECAMTPMQTKKLDDRAEQMLQQAAKINCRRFVSPKDVTSGNRKLNFAFAAHIFNTMPGLEELTQEEKAALDMSMFNGEGDREARVFALWINCLGVEPFVGNLFEDLRDGLVLLRVMDKVVPGIVDWSRVNQKIPLNKFKAVENCNYAVVLGKQLKFSLVGVGGSDINEGNRTLTLAVVWQLMREHIIRILSALGGGVKISDADIVAWANAKARAGGSRLSMSDFRDGSLRSSLFVLDLLNAIRPGTVEAENVTDGVSEEAALDNAKYAIALARRIGCAIFLLPEDIVEVQPKMMLTLFGSLMSVDKGATH